MKAVALKILLLFALVASGSAEARSPTRTPRTSIDARLKSVALDLRQAARQVRSISGDKRSSLAARVGRSIKAIGRSLGIGRAPAVLLYQGAFDPVHRGHLANIRAAVAGLGSVGKLYVVPTSKHPGKTPLDRKHRIAMIERSLGGAKLPSSVKISVVKEAELARVSASGFDALTRMIHSEHPGARVYIMTGADAFSRAKSKGLVARALRWGYRYAVTPREGYPTPGAPPVGVELMTAGGGKESSSAIRAQLSAQRMPRSLDAAAAAYISSNRLYGYGEGLR